MVVHAKLTYSLDVNVMGHLEQCYHSILTVFSHAYCFMVSFETLMILMWQYGGYDRSPADFLLLNIYTMVHFAPDEPLDENV